VWLLSCWLAFPPHTTSSRCAPYMLLSPTGVCTNYDDDVVNEGGAARFGCLLGGGTKHNATPFFFHTDSAIFVLT
jgi:hypothetical protein